MDKCKGCGSDNGRVFCEFCSDSICDGCARETQVEPHGDNCTRPTMVFVCPSCFDRTGYGG